jgi:hypothetical protein
MARIEQEAAEERESIGRSAGEHLDQSVELVLKGIGLQR